METQRLRAVAYKDLDTLNYLNLNLMKEILLFFPNLTHRKHNLYVPPKNRMKSGSKSFMSLAAHILSSLPENMK